MRRGDMALPKKETSLGVADEENAKAARDMCIGCLGRLNETIWLAKENCPEEFFTRYRIACARVMGDIVEVLRNVFAALPALELGDQAWREVAERRRAADPTPTGLDPHRTALQEIQRTASVVDQIRELSPVFSTMVEDTGIRTRFEALGTVAKPWSAGAEPG
jgi:hypothetical protein